MDDCVVIITGGAQGIGLACARRFLKDGWSVVIADTDEEAAKTALADLEHYQERLVFHACDVSDKLSVHNLIAEVLSRFGRMDVLINNAAILQAGGILDLDDEVFDEVMGVNLRGAFLVSKAVAQHMVEEIENRVDRSRLSERPYTIINISSINEQVAMGGFLAYTVTKGGIRQMTRSMAVELAPYGIRVNAISPGSVKTRMSEDGEPDRAKIAAMKSRTPLGRLGLPDEIAGVAAFLASQDASYITGQSIYVDGGRLALNHTMPEPKPADEDPSSTA